MNRKIKTRRGSRFGATSIFLAIILTAIVFVECTYVSMFANLDRRMTYTRAVTAQVDQFLSMYNRELLRAYGIYAFDLSEIDDTVFQEVLLSNGISEDAVIVVSGLDEFDTEDLKKAISMFYSYREPSIMFNYFREQIAFLIEQLDEYGVVPKVQEFMNTEGMEILSKILTGVTNVAEFLDKFSDSEEGKGIARHIDEFIDIITQYSHSRPDIGDNYDRGSLEIGIDSIEFLSGYFNSQSELIENVAFHPFCAHYATYNFDSRLIEETTINGTDFSEFHEGNISDVEYILTGFEGVVGETITAFMIFQTLYAKNLVNCILDTEIRETFAVIGEVLSALIALLSEGTVYLPGEVYECVMMLIYSFVLSSFDLTSVLRGDTIDFFSIEDVIDLKLGYKDLVSMYMSYIPDFLLLDRMHTVLTRDFNTYICGIEVYCERPYYTVTCERSYLLYA